MRTSLNPLKVFAAVILIAASPRLPAAPTIGEFQADNNTTLDDSDGDASDWVEIYNPDATTANLTGMSLTDDPLVLRKWVFPNVSLPAKSSLLVWCSGKNRTNPAQPLHTNFDLAREGEYLALIAADGTTKLTEFNPYPEQFEDRSYGSSRPVITQTPVVAGAACRIIVPTGTIVGWQNPGFVDTTWTAAVTGIGYDTNFTLDYRPMIGAGGTVGTTTNTCYVRIPFSMTNASDVVTMTLRVKFDDGFAAFLNGTRLDPPAAGDTNAPASLAFNSNATTVHPDSDAVVFQPFDISSQKSLLINGTNMLAIQAMNGVQPTSDMLLVPELVVTKTDTAAPISTGYFAQATPAINNASTPVAGFVDAPDFSVKRGFFTTPQTITLTTKTQGAQIRYTTNGTAPTATTGTVYTAPVTIAASSVLRAGAFRSGWEPSTVKSHTYIFAAQVVSQPAAPAGYPAQWGNEYNFSTGTLTGPPVPADYRMDPVITGNVNYSSLMVPALTTTLPVISLAGDITEIFGSANGIYSNGRITAGLEKPVSMEFWDPVGNPATAENWQENCGLRMHGGDAPIEHPKKPFRVYFRKFFDVRTGRLRQPLFAGSPVDSFDKLQLRPGGHDGWAVPFGSGNDSLARHATYCRDRFLRQTELDMGRLSHRGRFAHLYINGLYWGFYDIHEVQSKEFFADHLGGTEDEWDVYEHTNTSNPLFDVVDGTPTAMDAALALVRPPNNIASQTAYEALGAIIDYDEFIDNCIVQMWGAQNDWMGPVFRGIPGVNLTDASRFFNKNWESGRRSRGPDPTGLFWQVWDAEISMGSSLTSLVPTMRVADFNHTLIGTPTTDINRTPGVPGPPGEIFYALRKYNTSFRMRVADRLNKHLFNGGAMTTANNQARLLALRNQLDLPIVAESARWGDVNYGDPVGTTVTFTRNDHWRSEMDWLRDTYIATRNATILSQFAAIGMWPSTQPPAFGQHGGSVPSGYQLTITDPNAAGGTIYYTLDGTDPMTSLSTTPVKLLGPDDTTPANGTPCYYKPPTYAYPSNSWKDITPPWEGIPPAGLTQEQELATWVAGPVGIGFDVEPYDFLPHTASWVLGMQGVTASCYMRVPFTVTPAQKAGLVGLTLRLKYDDGAYVFLNGSTPVHRLNYDLSQGSPAFTDKAAASRPDAQAMAYETLDVSAQIPTLVEGSGNVLAIQGLNFNANDDDFLCVPELIGNIALPPTPGVGAQTYTAPVSLPQSGSVRARVLKSGIWSAITEASFIVGVPASASNLTITEFSYNPVASPAEFTAGFSGQQFEFIELMNISAGPVQLTGCRFDDGISFEFTGNSVITPGQRILLVSDQAAFNARHPGVPVYGVFQNQSNLSNSGERLELLSAAGADIFDFSYDDNSPWPTPPDGGGSTLVLINPMADPDPGVAANWRASASAGGTPGGSDADSYNAWAGRHSVTGGMAADSNNNGLTNLAEYGLGLIPSSSETDGIYSAKFENVDVGGTTGTYLVLRYRHQIAADDVIVTPQMSTDMESWTSLTDEVPPVIANPNGTEDLARRSPLPVTSDARVYVRLSVTTR